MRRSPLRDADTRLETYGYDEPVGGSRDDLYVDIEEPTVDSSVKGLADVGSGRAHSPLREGQEQFDKWRVRSRERGRV